MGSIHAASGITLDELADIRQSITDILTTPVGTRVMRRDYGSHIFDLIDAPGTELGAMRVIAAAADAIARWEHRVVMKSGRMSVNMAGAAVLSITCVVKASGLTITADSQLAGAA